ncbi:hypothetical protein XENOCAPTIV_007957 [Xenoophorus captivus]|uniref:Uncharacterized protein n=1 Tax=Xenoophorus captivus TaxID=1517983 RepID=A0ABV0QZ49_9TELE
MCIETVEPYFSTSSSKSRYVFIFCFFAAFVDSFGSFVIFVFKSLIPVIVFQRLHVKKIPSHMCSSVLFHYVQGFLHIMPLSCSVVLAKVRAKHLSGSTCCVLIGPSETLTLLTDADMDLIKCTAVTTI